MPEDAPGNPGAERTEPPARQVAFYRTVREMQAKLHRWAGEDPSRRFGDLFNLVCDLEFLAEAWLRVKQNKGSRTPGIDGATVADIENWPGGVGVFLEHIRAALKSGEFRPDPVRQVVIPKKSGKLRKLGITTVADRVVQAALKLVLEPIFEADFQPCSYGFRPNRRAHDAIAEIHFYATRGYEWVLEADIRACFDEIGHVALMDRLRARITDKRVCALVKAFLKAGVMTADGDLEESYTGARQGGIFTPPTQQRTIAHVTLRVGGVVAAVPAAGLAGGDAVADGDFLGADEDVLDDGAQDALAVPGGGGGGAGAELSEEALEVVGEFQVGVAVGGLGVEGGDLVLQPGFAGAEVRHAGTELVNGEELLGERGDHRADRRGGLREGLLELAPLAGHRVRCPRPLESLADLGADEGGVGEQAGDVVPDDRIDVVGADGLVGADAAALVAVVVGDGLYATGKKGGAARQGRSGARSGSRPRRR